MFDDAGPRGLPVLAGLVFFAGVVDSLAGGGGLVTVPAYLAAGLDPRLVLGTNKLASALGTVASGLAYQRRLKLDLAGLGAAMAAAVGGAWLGAQAATRIAPELLKPLLLAALPPAAAVVLSARPSAPRLDSRVHRRRVVWVALGLGAYDGFLGPGTGTFLAIGLHRFCGLRLIEATGRAKVLNLASNMAALAAFLAAGRVDVSLGLSMGVASFAGHAVGSALGLGRGERLIRPALALVCAALFAKIAWDVLAGL